VEVHPVEGFPSPGTKTTPTDELPVLRLDPPGPPGWFLEVRGAHGERDPKDRSFERMETRAGHFALASFRYLVLAERNALETDLGVRVARPEAMALANLLAHPRIGPARMSQSIEGRDIKRSNKDLGRVLAIADLAGDAAVQTWSEIWWTDLQACFGAEAQALARRAGDGLRGLLAALQTSRKRPTPANGDSSQVGAEPWKPFVPSGAGLSRMPSSRSPRWRAEGRRPPEPRLRPSRTWP